jgi:hypothetical protein
MRGMMRSPVHRHTQRLAADAPIIKIDALLSSRHQECHQFFS